MKGLLIKEFFNDKLLIIIGIIVFICSVGELSTGKIANNVSGLCIVLYLFALVTSFSFTLDRNSKWDGYIITMPIKKERIIMSKYLLIFIMMLTALIIAIPIVIIGGNSFFNIVNSILLNIAIVMIVTGLMIPLTLKLGQNVSSIIIIVIVGFQAFFMFTLKNDKFSNYFVNINGSLLIFILFVFSIIVFVVSYKISARFYKKMNF